MLVLKTLLNIGMENIVPPTPSRRHSTGNLAFEYTDVVSPYLKDPVSSCHDNCKPLDNPTPEKPNKPPSAFKKLFTSIPKPSTKDAKIPKIKPLPNEPIKHEFLKPKRTIDPFYIPPSSKTHRRRYSEIILPTGGLEDVLDPDPPPVPGFTRPWSSKKIDNSNSNNKTESRKDPVKNANIPKKVQNSRTQSDGEVDHGSKKSKPPLPTRETVKENTDETTCNERVIENGSNEASTSKKEETLTLKTNDRNNNFPNDSQTSKKNETLTSHVKKPETSRRVGKSNGDNYTLPQKMKFKQGKMVDDHQSSVSTSRKINFKKQVSDVKSQIEDENGVSLRRLCSDGVLQSHESSNKSVNVILNKAQDVENNKKRHSGLNNVIEETASKLIETRKSRVQALVGAFEMISESKL